MPDPVFLNPPPSGVWSFNITVTEADAIISRWAQLEACVIYAEGDLARFVQRCGRVELARPGVPVHRAVDTHTAVFVGRFAEIFFVEDDAYEMLMFRRPAGVNSPKITFFIAESSLTLEPDAVLALAQAARSVRSPVE